MSITLRQLADRYAQASKMTKSEAEKYVRGAATVGVGYVKQEIQSMHAVDTGTMLNSTTTEKMNSTTFLIGPTVEYAVFVALGTSYVPSRPFHTFAARRLQGKIDSGGITPKTLGI